MIAVIHQCSALQAAAILAAIARDNRQWYLIEGDGLGAYNADRRAWVYERAAYNMVPGLGLREEPKYEDFEPDPFIEPTPVLFVEETKTEERHLPKVIVAENTSPALRLLKGGWFREERNEEEEDARRAYGYSRT